MDCSFRYQSNCMSAGSFKPVISFEDEQVSHKDDEITSLSDLLRFRGLFFNADLKKLIICDCCLLEIGQKRKALRSCTLKIGCKNGRALPRGKINVRQKQIVVLLLRKSIFRISICIFTPKMANFEGKHTFA